MIRLNLFMIWFLHFLSLLSVICRYYSQNSSSRIIVVLVYTVSTLFCVVTQDFRAQGVMDTLMNVASIPEESESRLPSEGLPPVTAAGSQRCDARLSASIPIVCFESYVWT